jgi:hypothetical protein
MTEMVHLVTKLVGNFLEIFHWMVCVFKIFVFMYIELGINVPLPKHMNPSLPYISELLQFGRSISNLEISAAQLRKVEQKNNLQIETYASNKTIEPGPERYETS